jgi:hypothetical protein
MHPVSWGIVSAEPVYIGCKSRFCKGNRENCISKLSTVLIYIVNK